MREGLLRIGFVLGTTLLLIGVSVLPAINALQTQDQPPENKKETHAGKVGLIPKCFTFVKFNITFYGETFFTAIAAFVPWFPPAIYFVAHSNNSVTPPVANIVITTYNDELIMNSTWYKPLKVRALWLPEYETNLTHEDPDDNTSPDPDGGYVSGRAVCLCIR